jgi:UDP-3-O-[3-hydroxymyristoyl] glucosamine N-acyltransferase
VILGDRCDIYPGAVIGRGCRLGDDVVVYPNAVLYDDVIVGNRVILHAGCVIGADGFSYRTVGGRHQRIPHFGTVRIEDDVEIGANATIDRAMVDETVIGQGTKLDNLVMIGHNCEVGQHNLFASQVGLAGSVTTGDYVVCAGQVGIADHVHLGSRCVLGAKAGVPKDVPAGKRYIGIPAIPEADCYRSVMATQKLPEMRQQFRKLERQVADLAALAEQLRQQIGGANSTEGRTIEHPHVCKARDAA